MPTHRPNRLAKALALPLLAFAGLFGAPARGAEPKAAVPPVKSPAPTAPSGVQAAASPGAAVSAAEQAAAKKVVGGLINAIRFDKRALADKYLAFAAMSEPLLGATYAELSPAERTQFAGDFRALLVATAFAKGHELFAYLDGVLYGAARSKGAQVHLPSTIVVHRNVKKTELKVTWVLIKDPQEPERLQVLDVVSLGDSTLEGVREEEVVPLVKEGGKAKLLQVVHDKAQALARTKAGP